MRSIPDSERLLPLRRFTGPGLYSVAYLGLLVQRKKLKARKIGRNYFTTEQDFREYLDIHAREEIRTVYLEFFGETRPATSVIAARAGVTDDTANDPIETVANGFFVGKKRLAVYVLTAAGSIIFLLLFSVFLIHLDRSSGLVSGASEAADTAEAGR